MDSVFSEPKKKPKESLQENENSGFHFVSPFLFQFCHYHSSGSDIVSVVFYSN